jgi:hypothetical protein
MPPPPVRCYPDPDALLRAVQNWASTHGYAVNKGRTDYKQGFMVLVCDRGSDSTRKKARKSKVDAADLKRHKVSTKQCGCEWRIRGNKQADGTWKISLTRPTHTGHEAYTHNAASASLRRLAMRNMEWQNIDKMLEAGSSPEVIMSYIQSQHNGVLPIESRCLYNRSAKLLRERLMGKTPIQALLTELRKAGMNPKFELNEKGNVVRLFFVHPKALQVYHEAYDVLLLDCTYKTNKFKMPLLNYVFPTGLHTSMQLALCFLSQEKKEDYL